MSGQSHRTEEISRNKCRVDKEHAHIFVKEELKRKCKIEEAIRIEPRARER